MTQTLISEGVVLCTGFNGVELGPENVSLLDRCPLLGTFFPIVYEFASLHIHTSFGKACSQCKWTQFAKPRVLYTDSRYKVIPLSE